MSDAPAAYRCWGPTAHGPGTHRTFYNPHTVRSLNFAWRSRGVPLLGAPDTRLLVPFPPWGSIKWIFPGTHPQWGKGGNNTHNWHQVSYLNFDIGASFPGVRTTFSSLATTLDLYPRFLDKTNFPRILTPRARYPQDPSTIPTRSGPWTLPGSPVVYRCWWHPAHVSWAHFPLGLDKPNFSRVPTPSAPKGATIPTSRTRSRTWTLTSVVVYPGVRTRLATWRSP